MPFLNLPAAVQRLRAAGCVFPEDEAQLFIDAAGTAGELDSMVDQRVEGSPVEHILGWAEFRGLRIAVAPGVFVPRPRTEFLVRCAADLTRSGAVVLDLCCGSGALGMALSAVQERIELHAADIDPTAVRCARQNLAPIGGRVHEGDLYQPLPVALRGHIDVLLSNVPYVPSEEIRLLPPEARVHEARGALDGGADGLDVLRRVAAEAPQWLAPGGHLLVETSEHQAAGAVALLVGTGLPARAVRSDELETVVVIATKPAGRRCG